MLDNLPWALVVAAFGWNTWLHLQLRDLYVKKAELTKQVEALAAAGTDGTVMAAIEELKGYVRAMNDKVEADYQTVAICLIQLSNGKPITPSDLKRKA